MANKIRFCPRCMNIIHRKDEKCSSCGLEVSKMQEMLDKEAESRNSKNSEANNLNLDSVSQGESKNYENGILVDTKAILGGRNGVKADSSNSLEMLGEQTETEMQSEATLNSSMAEVSEPEERDTIDSEEIGTVVFEQEDEENKPKRHKHKSKVNKDDLPKYSVDSDGSYNIDTSDVTYLEGVESPTYSVKKARGDAPKQEKLKWWEIYKWADRMLAKRKIMKEVKKASHKQPTGIKKGAMIAWCLFFGWLGIHNFYAHNFKKGWTVVAFDIIMCLVINIEPLFEFMGIFVGGGLGFVVLAMWLYDLFCLLINKYRYRISKEEFISNLNVETRMKLGKKYVGLDRTVFKAKEQARLEKLNKKKNKKTGK